jgi:hypothetical protein
MSATPVNPLALGIGAGASFAGGILGAIGSGPSKQMEALNSQIQDFSQGMTSLAKQEGIDAGTVFNNLMQPLQRIVQGGPSQAGWSQAQVNAYNTQAIQRGAATARDLGALIGGGPGGMGGKDTVDLGNATTQGGNNRLAAAQAAEAQTSAAESEGTIKSNEAGREEFNTAVGEEKQLPGVFATANQGGSVAGEVNKEAQVSQQNIDTEKRGASFSGVLSKGLSGAGGAMLGGLSPATAASKLAAQQMVPGMQGKSAADAGLDAGEATADTGTMVPPTSGGPMTGDN